MIFASVLSDVDGDGDLDAIGFAVYRNRHFRAPTSGFRRQYGIGLAGTGGRIPVLGASGPFRIGVPGQVRLTCGVGGTYGLLGVGLQETATPIVGGTLLTNPSTFFDLVLNGQPGAPGAGTATLNYVADVSLLGFSFYAQVGLADAGAPQGISLSNGLNVTFGP